MSPPTNSITRPIVFSVRLSLVVLEAAIEFYTATFPDSEVRNVARTGKDGPISSAEFVEGCDGSHDDDGQARRG